MTVIEFKNDKSCGRIELYNIELNECVKYYGDTPTHHNNAKNEHCLNYSNNYKKETQCFTCNQYSTRHTS